MKIKYIKAKNFLCIGETPIEIDFTKCGNVVNIRGENHDVGPGASNASGKSTLSEAVVYAIFGELIKKLNHGEAINVDAGKKGLEVEIHFELTGHDYRIVRRRGPDELELWEDGVNISKGGMPATQEEINSKIKLNATSFTNICCFGQHNNKQFLGCKPADKRAIAENLLSLDKYNKFCQTAKDKLKVFNDEIKVLTASYEKAQAEVTNADRQIKQIEKQQDEWKIDQLTSIDRLKGQLNRLKGDMAKLSAVAPKTYEEVQSIADQIEIRLRKKGELTNVLQVAHEKILETQETRQNEFLTVKELQYSLKQKDKQKEDTKQHSKSLLCTDGNKCPVCYGKVNKANFQTILDYNQTQVSEIDAEIEILNSSLQKHQANLQKADMFLSQLRPLYEKRKAEDMENTKSIRELEQKKILANAAFRENADSVTLLLEQQISNLTDQIAGKQRDLENDPYIKIISGAKKDFDKSKEKAAEFKVEIESVQKQLPYFDFWVKAFGDDGIRAFILAEIIPILNSRINYWLQFLIDNKIKLHFNSNLEERIEKLDKKYLYRGVSGGENQRIDLGIALAFAQVMMLSAGTSPSIIFLDEVGTNLDRPGIQAIYNTICELARERQVLVTTHDPDLQEMLAGYETITVIKKNGLSVLKN